MFRVDYRKIETLSADSKAIQKIVYAKKDPKKISTKINEVLSSVRDINKTYQLLQTASIKWIQVSILPLKNEEKTKSAYIEWMRNLATTRLHLVEIVDEKISLDPSQNIDQQMILIQKKFEDTFGKEAFVIPLVEYLMEKYSQLPEFARKTILSFLNELLVKETQEDQIKAILCEKNTQGLRKDAHEIIQLAFEHEINNSNNFNNLLRNDTLATKLFNFYCKREGTFWLNTLFSSFWKALAPLKEDLSQENPEINAIKEVYAKKLQERIKPSLSLASNAEKSSSLLSEDFQLSRADTGRLIQKIPPSIYSILKRIHDATLAKFPNEIAEEFHITFLYMRVLSPCFIFTESLGFPMDLKKPLSQEMHALQMKNRKAIANLLQKSIILSNHPVHETVASNPLGKSKSQDDDRLIRKTVSLQTNPAAKTTTPQFSSPVISRNRSSTILNEAPNKQ